MDKEALLGIILSDVKEVDTLLNSFKGKSAIKPAFIKLTLQKVDNIKQELELLRDLAEGDDTPVQHIETPVKHPKVDVIEVAVPKPIEASTPVVPPVPTIVPDIFDIPAESVAETLAPTKPVEPAVEVAPKIVEQEVAQAAKNEPVVEVVPLQPSAQSEMLHAHNHPQSKHAPTLGESLVTDKGSVFDKFQGSKDGANPALIGKPVDDIKKAIGINDRFLYQRELFGNNADLMNQTIGELNGMSSLHEALGFIATNFNWDQQDETTVSFMNLVRRKFR